MKRGWPSQGDNQKGEGGHEGSSGQRSSESYKLKFKRLAEHVAEEQKVAYVSWPGPDGRELLRSAIVTPVFAKAAQSP